jgi:hypothetical protein
MYVSGSEILALNENTGDLSIYKKEEQIVNNMQRATDKM